MAAKGLFDDKRRKEVRDAIRKDELAKILKRKEPEPETDYSITRIYDRNPEPPGPEAEQTDEESGMDSYRGRIMQSSFITARPGRSIDEAQQSLFDAIKEGSVRKVQDAVARGADVNQAHIHVPKHREGDCVMLGPMTPLEYAKKKGWPQIVALLKRYGAQE